MTAVQSLMMSSVKRTLRKIQQETSNPVTAGQLAKHAGFARSTAKKYLIELERDGDIKSVKDTHVNGQTMTRYFVVNGWGQ